MEQIAIGPGGHGRSIVFGVVSLMNNPVGNGCVADAEVIVTMAAMGYAHGG